MAALNEVENKFSCAAESLSTFHSTELRKSLVALRKSAESIDKNLVVTKAEFDKHLEKTLAPCLKQLPDDLRELGMGSRSSFDDAINELRGSDQDIFLSNKDEAALRSTEIAQEYEVKKATNYNDWLAGKLASKKQAKANEVAKKKLAADDAVEVIESEKGLQEVVEASFEECLRLESRRGSEKDSPF